MIATIHKNVLRVLLTLTALAVFATNNNGVLVSAAASRNLGKSGSSKFECSEAVSNVKVEVQGTQGASQNSWEIIDACTGKRVAKGKGSDSQDEFTYLCVPHERYKFTMLDSVGNGLAGEFRLEYDAGSGFYPVADETDFPGSGFEIYFGDKTACCAAGESLVEGVLFTDENPKETSYELRDFCSGEIIQFIDFDEDQVDYRSASEVCVPDNGKYLVSVSDTGYAGGITDGIDGDSFGVFSAGFGINFGPGIALLPNGFGDEFGTYLGLKFGTSDFTHPCLSGGKSKSAKKSKKTRKLKRRVLGNKQE